MKPNPSTPPCGRLLAQLLQQCLSSPNQTHLQLHLRPVHARSIVLHSSSDLFLNNLLLNAYSKSNAPLDARKVFDRMPHRNLISYSSLISAHTHHRHCAEALSVFSAFLASPGGPKPNEFILASVLRACVQSEAAGAALQVHCLSVKSGFHLDVFVGTSLIAFYSKSGSMDDAASVFDEMPVKNSVTWTALISGYVQTGRSDVSLRLFDRMRASGVEADKFVVSSVVSACSALGFLQGGRQAHGFVFRSGMRMDVSVNNVLIDLYCRCGRVRTARRVFDWTRVKNLVSWSSMISGYMQNLFEREVIALFLEMGRSGWLPDAFACTSVLCSCGSIKALEVGAQIHAFTIKAVLESDDYVKNALIDMYSKCDSLDDARLVFDASDDLNVVSYNAMIEGYARQDKIAEAFTLFNDMRRSKLLRPSLLTFVSLLGVSASLSLVYSSKQVHCLVIKSGVSLDFYAGSALVDVYSKCSCVDDARTLFEEIAEKDLVVWNAMISGYTQNDLGEDALNLFNQLRVSGMRPDQFTFVAVLTVASNLASLFHGLQFHNHIIKAGVDYDSHVSNALVDMYAKCGCIQEAWLLFDSTRGRDVVCWNSMISRYAHHGYAKEALRVFQLMRGEKIEPNYVTFVGVLSACDHVGLVDEGLHHFNSMKQDFNIEPGMEHYASVVNLLGRAGKLDDTKEFIERMPIDPAAIVWRSLLSACREFGNVELGRYAAGKAISIDPNDTGPYVLLSNIYASKGMWQQVKELRKRMDSAGVVKEAGYSWIEVMNKVHVFIARGRAHKEADLIYSVLDGLAQMIKSVEFLP
ncbi:pentatricopeptide repeat-containing protein [Iris pallida]|uniref:Pentatricopeptide repeat-containing protein n=1 Tax=Iris pallida TaxID=29817 RepID=A0AAX6EIY6_IRIPA|nr:pentatricopeptide repeat-containing protein [Iris pallida]